MQGSTLTEKTLLIQSNEPCFECGSWYRVIDRCNRCGHLQPRREEQVRFSYVGRASKGRKWNSKKHKYEG
jgi:hypothetical protein